MAMIKCPECGKEISDKAESCPGCGCPASEFNIEREIPTEEKFDKVLLDTHEEFAKHTVMWGAQKEIEAISNRMGVDIEKAKALRQELVKFLVMKNTERANSKKAEQKAKYEQGMADLKDPNSEKRKRINARTDFIVSAMGIGETRCPRCHSTSITYDTKKLSVGRGVVGGLVAGTPGMIMGGLSSKKGYAVCLNCGKRWKI